MTLLRNGGGGLRRERQGSRGPGPILEAAQERTSLDRSGDCAEQRERFARAGQPIVAIDTKKNELIGHFKNPGRAWSKEPVRVNDHDFRSDALGIAVPYGLYDTLATRGSLYVGTSHDTPEFAADNLVRWWCDEGEARYPGAIELLVLADGGGSNGYRNRAFKYWRLRHGPLERPPAPGPPRAPR